MTSLLRSSLPPGASQLPAIQTGLSNTLAALQICQTICSSTNCIQDHLRLHVRMPMLALAWRTQHWPGYLQRGNVSAPSAERLCCLQQPSSLRPAWWLHVAAGLCAPEQCSQASRGQPVQHPSICTSASSLPAFWVYPVVVLAPACHKASPHFMPTVPCCSHSQSLPVLSILRTALIP